MNQQEILRNMTQDQWMVNQFKRIVFGIDQKMICTAATDQRSPKENIANVEAIYSAVNNTYGKGIDPEHVEDYKSCLEGVIEAINDATHYENGRLQPAIVQAIKLFCKKVLDAAELKSTIKI